MGDEGIDDLLSALRSSEGAEALDEAFALLSDRYVRYVLAYLADHRTASIEELADVVAGREATERDAIVSPGDRRSIRLRLYHVTLPKLDAHGYVAFDHEERTVARAAVPAFASALLEVNH